jgi:hypothetical protein
LEFDKIIQKVARQFSTGTKFGSEKEKFQNPARPNFAKRKQRSKWKIPPQTPPFPFATSEFKNK